MPNTVKYLFIVGSLWLLAACGKYRLFDNLEVVEQTYTGLITVSKSGQDTDGVFEGTMDSGSYSFIWDNPSRGAVLYLELTAHSGGSVQLVIFDAKGNEVLQETRSAIGSGAFGGSRAAVGQAEVGRNVLEQQARTGSQLRSAGFSQALQASQNAFEAARNRQLQTAQTMGNLAQGLGQAGVQQAGLGEAFQGAQQADVNALLSLGGLEQQQAQNILEAQRQTALQRQMEPYQRVGFLSDIFQGIPTASSTTQTTSAPGPSAISQIAGLGLGLAGLQQSGVLGGLGSLV